MHDAEVAAARPTQRRHPRPFAQLTRDSKAHPMTTLAMELDEKLKQWDPGTAQEVSALVSQIIELADNDSLDLLRSRTVEQEVLDLLDDART